MGSPAVFLDRDGTIIEEADYLSDPDQVRLLPGAAEGLRMLRDAGFMLVVATNQSGIGRGYFTEADLGAVNQRLTALLEAEGVTLDAVYHCPHAPDAGCDCRKPKVGMARKAEAEFGIDVTASYFVGDKASDLRFGETAGGKTVLTLTGYGKEELRLLMARGTPPRKVVDGLLEAAVWIVRDFRSSL